MAGDFTQEQSLTRHCQEMCHLQQTCQLTRMQFGIETDQFPNCQQDMALIAALYFVKLKKKKYYLFGYIVNFSFASQACSIPRYRSKIKYAANFRFQKFQKTTHCHILWIKNFNSRIFTFQNFCLLWTRHAVHVSGFAVYVYQFITSIT